MKLLIALSLLATAAFAQDVPPITPAQPTYVLAAGAGFNHYSTPQANGWMTFGVRIADNTYELSTIDMTSKTAALRTGIARVLLVQGPFTLTALGDLGVATGGGNVGASLSAGGTLSYDVSKWTKVPGTSVVAGVRVLKPTTDVVQPAFVFGFSKTF